MENKKASSKAMNVALWVAQIFLAVSLIWAAWMKLFFPIDRLSALWPWTDQIPLVLVKCSGMVDLLGAMGLILPALFRVRQRLVPMAAVAIVILMLCAGVFHVLRGEASVIGVNIVFAVVAGFVAWGRRKVGFRDSRN